GGLAEFLQRLRRLDHDAVTTTSNCVVAAADAREGLPKETLSMALVAQPSYWDRPPEMLQKTFLTWLPRMIRTTITTTAIKTRMRAYSTMPCPSSRLSSSRRRRYKLVSICVSPPFARLRVVRTARTPRVGRCQCCMGSPS